MRPRPVPSRALAVSALLACLLVAPGCGGHPATGTAPVADGAEAPGPERPQGDPSLAPEDARVDPELQHRLEELVDRAERDHGVAAGISVLDRAGATRAEANATATVRTASISKVPIAMAYLGDLRRAGEEVSPDDHALLRASLADSDNAATEQLYTGLGVDEQEQIRELAETYRSLGMDSTRPEEGWGVTPTDAQDEIRIVHALHDPPGWLDPADAGLIRDYLTPVPGTPHQSQAFGVGALITPDGAFAGPAPEELYVKNGWLAEDDGSWSVSSVGHALVAGHGVDLAITTFGFPTAEEGFELTSALAAEVTTAVTEAGEGP